MKRLRLVSVAAAIALTAIQWVVFFNPVLYTQSVRALGGPVAEEGSDTELPVVVITGHRL